MPIRNITTSKFSLCNEKSSIILENPISKEIIENRPNNIYIPLKINFLKKTNITNPIIENIIILLEKEKYFKIVIFVKKIPIATER